MKIKLMLVILMALCNVMKAADYCLAIRGNGEAMPAHWGAVSAVIQRMEGMPYAMSGGSSASITMFLLQSLAQNAAADTPLKKAFLVKSFQGYFEALENTPEGMALKSIIGDQRVFGALKNIARGLEGKELPNLISQHLNALLILADTPDFKRLLNPDFVNYIRETLELPEEGPKFRYRKQQIAKAINGFGKFDAATDDTLFFRPGIINFRHVAKLFGVMADFYSGTNAVDFLAACLRDSESLTWRGIVKKNLRCADDFKAAVIKHLKQQRSKVNINRKVENSAIKAFPTTTVLMGEAVSDYHAAREKYLENSDEDFVPDFLVAQENLRFGYWGGADDLSKIKNSLNSDNEKSKKFLALENGTWMEVLSTSPAEPGLASLVPMSNGMLSGGGWGDLAPTLVLKAYGCKEIVYITRSGGDSLFAQGVMKRFTDYDGFEFTDWVNLDSEGKRRKNAEGNAADIGEDATLWSRLYNLQNPQSSLVKSHQAATITVKTNWDQFSVYKEMDAMILDAFQAPW